MKIRIERGDDPGEWHPIADPTECIWNLVKVRNGRVGSRSCKGLQLVVIQP